MNILKKALLLTSFILMGMLLLSSYTTNSSHTTGDSFFTDDDDFGITLVRGGSRSGDKDCMAADAYSCDAKLCVRKPEGSTPTSISVTISVMQQIWFVPIYQETFTNQELFGTNNFGSIEKLGLYQPYSGMQVPAVVDLTIDGVTISDFAILTPNCN